MVYLLYKLYRFVKSVIGVPIGFKGRFFYLFMLPLGLTQKFDDIYDLLSLCIDIRRGEALTYESVKTI